MEDDWFLCSTARAGVSARVHTLHNLHRTSPNEIYKLHTAGWQYAGFFLVVLTRVSVSDEMQQALKILPNLCYHCGHWKTHLNYFQLKCCSLIDIVWEWNFLAGSPLTKFNSFIYFLTCLLINLNHNAHHKQKRVQQMAFLTPLIIGTTLMIAFFIVFSHDVLSGARFAQT